ncbi:MAG: alpha/beta hydrolase, partial [Chloroflexi bacterium]|nr:alpha/beta hydrolase [Chloroflexota bacterium]
MAHTEDGTSKFIQAGEVKIHYHDAGRGPACVLLHGGGPGATGWANYSRNIDAFAEDFRVLIPDLPQFGKSGSPIIPIDRTMFNAHVLKDLLDAL